MIDLYFHAPFGNNEAKVGGGQINDTSLQACGLKCRGVHVTVKFFNDFHA